MTNNSLQHYGILGMKWGVRRTPEQLGHKPTKEERKETKTLKRQTAAAIKNMKEHGEIVKEYGSAVSKAEQAYEKANKKMYLFKKNRYKAIEAASENLSNTLKLAEKPQADFERSIDLYEKTAKKLLDNNKKMIEKYGKDTIKELQTKNIQYGITDEQTGLFTRSYTAYVGNVLKTGPTVVSIPWYGQRYTGKFAAKADLDARNENFKKATEKRY